MIRYTDWVWSQQHSQFYCASYDQTGQFLQYHWAGAEGGSQAGVTSGAQSSTPAISYTTTPASFSDPRTVSTSNYNPSAGYYQPSSSSNNYTTLPARSLPWEVRETVGGDKPRRHIKTGHDGIDHERLDPEYRRVIAEHIPYFFVRGRVFKMLWIEPAGQTTLGQTRGSTHFSIASYGETAYSEIRRFIVVNPKGTFSQCIPIQTYRKQGALKPGLLVQDHGVVYTGHANSPAPNLLYGEGITKYPIRVEPKGREWLRQESRINFGKPYAVEHNVKVSEIGMVAPEHMHLLESYFHAAMRP